MADCIINGGLCSSCTTKWLQATDAYRDRQIDSSVLKIFGSSFYFRFSRFSQRITNPANKSHNNFNHTSETGANEGAMFATCHSPELILFQRLEDFVDGLLRTRNLNMKRRLWRRHSILSLLSSCCSSSSSLLLVSSAN